MEETVHAITNNEEWRKEKLDFICSVISDVDQDSLVAELSSCETDEDAEGLMQSLILLQDNCKIGPNDVSPNIEILIDNGQLPVHNDIMVRLPQEDPVQNFAQVQDPVQNFAQVQEEAIFDNDVIVHLPEINPLLERQEVEIVNLSDDDSGDDEVSTPEQASAEDDEPCFAADVFNSLTPNDSEESETTNDLTHNESEENETSNHLYHEPEETSEESETGIVNSVEDENVLDEETQLAQALAESLETTQKEAEMMKLENKIMSQVAILTSLFNDADPDFLQERIDECLKLEGDEERFQSLVEANLEMKDYPKMKDYLKRRQSLKETDVLETDENSEVESFEVIEDTEALEENLTIECGICLEENILGIDTSTCSAFKNEHTYCKKCIKRYVEAQIGQGLTTFKCMEGYCNAEFSLKILQKIMDRQVISKLHERRQQEEVAAAGVENLESCPFCNYMVSMPNENDRIFQCWNPSCMIDSCRRCKEPNHIPLRCDEVEKKNQISARLYVENEMAEAMIRECPKCKKRFIIEAGCNRMTCPCGAVMCYVCKKLLDTTNGDGYSHFERGPVASNKCPLYVNATTLHDEEVRGAAARAKQEVDKVKLFHDPIKDL